MNIAHPRYPQKSIPRGVHGENIQQNYPYHYYPSMPTQPHPSMGAHPHQHMPLTIYPIIAPHQLCLCPYFTSNTTYASYLVPYYPHISSLSYLPISYSRLPSYVLPPSSSKNITEYRRNKSDRIWKNDE